MKLSWRIDTTVFLHDACSLSMVNPPDNGAGVVCVV
jgi:hypothetical protein